MLHETQCPASVWLGARHLAAHDSEWNKYKQQQQKSKIAYYISI